MHDPDRLSSAPGRHPPPARRRPRTEFSIPELVGRVLLGRRSGGPSISSTVSTPSRFEKRLNDIASNPTVSRRTTRPGNQNSTRRRIRRPRQATTADADDINDLARIVIFGSVARGTTCRAGWRDAAIYRRQLSTRPTERYRLPFVVVDGNRTTARRQITDVVADPEFERFDGDRFVFEPYVESAESAGRAGSKLHEIFTGDYSIRERPPRRDPQGGRRR